MLSFIKNWGVTFQPATLSESHDCLDNPGRGWYRIYTYRLGEEEPEMPVRYADETLALVLMNIGAYKERDLDEEILNEMDRILRSFEELEFDLILRICYDTEGKGMVREPSLFSQVKNHLLQIAPLLRRHADRIFVYQGLLVGNWGEMHGSRYLMPKCLKELAETFLRETAGKVPLAFRKPCQYRTAFAEDSLQKGIGFFNDGLLGSETHLGTFAPETAGRGAWQEPWGIPEELRFMKGFLEDVPFGGEALFPPTALSATQVTETFQGLCLSYLNSTHDAALLAEWKKESLGGLSLYDYVGERLGYRFLIRNAQVRTGRNVEVSLEVENVGFGKLYEEASLMITWSTQEGVQGGNLLGELKGENRQAKAPNLSGLFGGTQATFCGTFPGSALPDAYEKLFFHAKIVRKRDGRIIQFAQESVDGCVFLGTLQRK